MTLARVRFNVPFMLRLVTPRPPSVGGLKLRGGGMAANDGESSARASGGLRC